MKPTRMLELAEGLAEAKSRQDVGAALAFLHDDMVLQNPAFGSCIRGIGDNQRALERWFTTFPDYEVEIDGHASTDTVLACWGRIRMTMTGEHLGVRPNGSRAELPVFIRFTFKDDLIGTEFFFFDLSTLCAQSGVSTDAVRRKIFGGGSGG